MLKKIIKFGIVGVIATLIDFSVFTVLVWFDINYIIANIIAFAISLSFNYKASMTYVFKAKEGMSVTKQAAIFFSLSIIGMIINTFLLFLLIDVIYTQTRLNIDCDLYAIASKILAVAVVMVFNFITKKIFLERK